MKGQSLIQPSKGSRRSFELQFTAAVEAILHHDCHVT